MKNLCVDSEISLRVASICIQNGFIH